MLRGRNIADGTPPTLPAVIGAVHAALIGSPQFSDLHAGTK